MCFCPVELSVCWGNFSVHIVTHFQYMFSQLCSSALPCWLEVGAVASQAFPISKWSRVVFISACLFPMTYVLRCCEDLTETAYRSSQKMILFFFCLCTLLYFFLLLLFSRVQMLFKIFKSWGCYWATSGQVGLLDLQLCIIKTEKDGICNTDFVR